MKRTAAALLLLAAGLATAQAASLPRGCDRPTELTAAQQDRLLRFTATLKQALDDSGASLALVARSGTDLSRFGLRYSHAGLALREGLHSPWAVRQLYLACTEGAPRLFDQGLAGFVSGSDDAEVGFIHLLLLPPEAAPLAAAALDTPRALALLGARYSANAHPFAPTYQNCNQWLAELIATAAGADATRPAAQAWLRAVGYAPEPVQAPPWLLLAGRFSPWLHFDDHPPAALAAGQVQTSLPPSLLALAKTLWPTAREVEFCHGPGGVLSRGEGGAALGARCGAQR